MKPNTKYIKDHSSIDDISGNMPPHGTDEFHYAGGDNIDIESDYFDGANLMILSEFDAGANFIQNGNKVILSFSDDHQVVIGNVGEVDDLFSLFS